MKLVILDSYALKQGDLDWSPLYKMVDEIEQYPRTAYEDIVPRLQNAEFAIVNKCRIDEDVLQHCPNLRWVGVTATGTDSLDVEACRRHGVAVSNVPSYSTNGVAQLTFALLLAGCKQVIQHNKAVQKGYWQLDVPPELAPSVPMELFGKTMGIVGYGEIGQQVAKIAQAFGMKVLVHTRTQRPQWQNHSVEFVDLEQVWAKSDVISLHCPATPQTNGIICKKSVSQMKQGVFLINTARGKLVQEQDLLPALSSGKIAFYGADVTATEPTPLDSPLRNLPNVLLTPHIAWTTPEALSRLAGCICSNLQSFLEGKPENIVNG